MGFDYCSVNEQYLVPLVEGPTGSCHYYGTKNALFLMERAK